MSATDSLAASLKQLRTFFDERGWKYCLIGGLAANRWGEARFTRDIDIVLLTGIGGEDLFVDQLLANFSSRMDPTGAKEFALQNRVLLLRSDAGTPIDISLGALPFEEEMLRRATPATIVAGQAFPVAEAEDLIVMKTIAGRPRDWQHIEGIIAVQLDKLNWKYIHQWLGPLLEAMEYPERTDELDRLRRRIENEKRNNL